MSTRPPPAEHPDPPERPHRWPWILGVVAAFVLGLGIGVLTSPGDSLPVASDSDSPTTVTVTASPPQAATTRLTEEPPSASYPSTTSDDDEGESAMSGDGYYVVGRDIRSGTYQSDGGDTCSWERLTEGNGGPDQVAESATPVGSTTVTILGSDTGFRTEGCGAWTRVG